MEISDLLFTAVGSVLAVVTTKSFIVAFFAAVLATFLTPFKVKDLSSFTMHVEMAMAGLAFVSLLVACLGLFASVRCWTIFSVTTGMLAGIGLIYKVFLQPDTRTSLTY